MIGVVFNIVGIIGVLYMCMGVFRKKESLFLISSILLFGYSAFYSNLLFMISNFIFIASNIYVIIDNKKKRQERKRYLYEDYLNLEELRKSIVSDLNNSNIVERELGLYSLWSVTSNMYKEITENNKKTLDQVKQEIIDSGL